MKPFDWLNDTNAGTHCNNCSKKTMSEHFQNKAFCKRCGNIKGLVDTDEK